MVGNRALDDPGAFGVEHNDALVVRDLGWMLIWVDTAQEMLDTTLLAYRIAEDRTGLPAARDLGRRRLPHALAGPLPGADQGQGGPVPAALQSRRPPAAPRQSDHGGPAGQRGLGDRDPPAERRGHEARVRRDRGGLRRLPEGFRARSREPVVRGVHDGRRRHHPGGHGHHLAALQGRHPEHARPGQEGRPRPAPLVPTFPHGPARPGALARPAPSASSTATTPSARPSTRAWSPTRSAPPCTTPTSGRRS